MPLSTSVPLPACVTAPVPLISRWKSVPCVIVLLRLKESVPLLVIALLADKEPVVPPAPTCKVPALMVVAVV